MPLDLICHPDTPTNVVQGICVSHEWRSPTALWLRYFVYMPLEQLVLPEPAEPERADELWQTSCFELFLRNSGHPAYCEFNFSPSSQWAAYAFADYRGEMQKIALPERPQISLDMGDTHFALETVVTLPEDYIGRELAGAISAVIETSDGRKSYWALAHPIGRPDFHHKDCFALKLSAAGRA